jgi:hypothetical protein
LTVRLDDDRRNGARRRVNAALVYTALLRLCPADFRMRFGAEMVAAFREAVDSRTLARATRDSRHAAYRLWIMRELASMARLAVREWIAKLTGDRAIRGRALPDPRMMRPPGITRAEWLRHV